MSIGVVVRHFQAVGMKCLRVGVGERVMVGVSNGNGGEDERRISFLTSSRVLPKG